MKKYIRPVLLSLLAILILLQFVRPAKNQSGEAANDIAREFAVSASLQATLRTACYDCHSNHTEYPWYAQVQPVGLWLHDHVDEGKGHLNFSEFAAYPLPRQYHKLEEINEMVGDGEMPLYSYTLLHRDAELTPAQRKEMIDWADALRDTLEAHYPMDSLVRKRQ